MGMRMALAYVWFFMEKKMYVTYVWARDFISSNSILFFLLILLE